MTGQEQLNSVFEVMGILRAFCFIVGLLLNCACAYHFSMVDRALPGGYSQVAIPTFKNNSTDVGIEPLFTNALTRRFERSQVANVVSKEISPVELEGTITSVQTVYGPPVTNATAAYVNLPDKAVLSTEYRLVVQASITLKRKSDEKIIWSGDFVNERAYSAPRIGLPVVNSANATYNQSARMETISRIAEEMMAEAHDRITESF